MEFKNIQLSKEDFAKSQWQELVASCEAKECTKYDSLFARKCEEYQLSGNERFDELFLLLNAICSFYLDLSSRAESYGPKWRFFQQGTRSAIPDDIPDMHWDSLAEIVADIKDAEIRARIADLLWLRRRDYRHAELAISSYLESAKILENPEHWTYCADRLERGLQLASELGKKTASYSTIIERLHETLLRYRDLVSSFFPARLMQMLLIQKQGEANLGIEISENLAQKAATSNDLRTARRYWELASTWHTINESDKEARKTRIIAAETYVKEAKLAAKKSCFLEASSHIKYAIEAMRRIGKMQKRIKELHELLVEYQKKSVDEMQSFTADYETSAFAQKARDYVKGREFTEVLFALALMGDSPKRSRLEAELKEVGKHAPLYLLIKEQIVTQEGKVIAHRPGALENEQAVLEAETYKHLTLSQRIHIDSTIEPARIQINEDNSISVRDILNLISNSPFVPLGREWIFARGLHAGLRGDFLMAAHLLIPQIENSVRYVLSQTDIITSSLDEEMIQEEYNINRTLKMKETEEIFGEDLVFDMRGLMVEKYGSNLRNRLAHGLMHIGEFSTHQCAYLWWTALRLCLLPIIKVNSVKPNKNN